MAVDDVTTVVSAALGAGSSATRQPADGVTEMLLDAGCLTLEGSAPNQAPAIAIRQIDGTNDEAVLVDGNNGNMVTGWFRGKFVANYTSYFQLKNLGNAGDLAFSIIEVG